MPDKTNIENTVVHTCTYVVFKILYLKVQGLKFKYFLSIQLGYQDSKFSIPPEKAVSHFWILVTISIIPCPIPITLAVTNYSNNRRFNVQSSCQQLDNSLIHKNAHYMRKGLGGKLVVFKSYQETVRGA
jgi:hypothetical protein